jgi:tetratricopeptide (TPR) repeat protein
MIDAERLSFEIYQELGECYLEVHQFGLASQYLEKARELYPRETRPLVALGVIALQEKQPEKARIWFEAALNQEPWENKALYGLGQVALAFDNPKEAWLRFQAALDLNPDNREALQGMLEIADQPTGLVEAAAALQAYLDRHPGDLGMYNRLAETYYRLGKVQTAVELLERLLIFEPENSSARELLARARPG